MATDPNYRDPAHRDPAHRDPAHTEYREPEVTRVDRDGSGSSWLKWAALAAALVLGVFLLTSLFDGDETQEVARVQEADPVVVTTPAPEAATEPATPVTPAPTTEAVPVTPAPTDAETPAAAPTENRGELAPSDPNVEVVPLADPEETAPANN